MRDGSLLPVREGHPVFSVQETDLHDLNLFGGTSDSTLHSQLSRQHLTWCQLACLFHTHFTDEKNRGTEGNSPGDPPWGTGHCLPALILASCGLLSMHSPRTLVRLVRSCHRPVQSPAVAASALSQSQVLRVAQEVPYHLPCLFSPPSPRHLFFYTVFLTLRYDSHTIHSTPSRVQFSGLGYIHKVVQSSLPSNSRASCCLPLLPSSHTGPFSGPQACSCIRVFPLVLSGVHFFQYPRGSLLQASA